MNDNDTTIDANALRQRLLSALAANRAPGFHLPGYFLKIGWPNMGTDSIEQTMATGPHCWDANGVVDPAVLGVMIDGALATAPRLKIETGGRLATVHLNMQYTGHPARGPLHAVATLEGFFASDVVKQAISRAVLTSDGRDVCYATGTFVQLAPPPGAKLAPLPWQDDEAPPPPLTMKELDENERAVMRLANAALAKHDDEHSFIERFWGVLPKPTPNGATCRVKIGPQIGNRVGHVQGGILVGLAQATASAAVPRHAAISNISAWYISPGRGKALTAKSKVIHAGRSFAVVRTEVRNADRSLVLEAVTNHAAIGAAKT